MHIPNITRLILCDFPDPGVGLIPDAGVVLIPELQLSLEQHFAEELHPPDWGGHEDASSSVVSHLSECGAMHLFLKTFIVTLLPSRHFSEISTHCVDPD